MQRIENKRVQSSPNEVKFISKHSSTNKNKILRLLFQFLSEYKGSPLYITGNALRHALSRQINTSFGFFTDQKRLHSLDNSSYNSLMNFFKLKIKK
ncbi:MAG: hypothetical protein ACFFDN_07695, partial [Candidatus Hodarchaeota archaeon]